MNLLKKYDNNIHIFMSNAALQQVLLVRHQWLNVITKIVPQIKQGLLFKAGHQILIKQ